ncbi:MAG: aminopeptidase P family protein, partial [Deltaproteobacteria bacterium]|nr:aminopeptidase P family protein [Deltaproteobacteria bacterium]
FVPPEGDPLVLVRKDVARAQSESPFPIEPLPTVRDVAERIRARVGSLPRRIGVEGDVLPLDQLERLRGLLPGAELRSASVALAKTRAVKSDYEVEQIRRAGEVVAQAVETVADHLREGVTELELAAAIEYELRRRGHGGLIRMRGFNQEIFYGHVFAGATAAAPSFVDAPTGGQGLSPALAHGASQRPIRRGEPVIVDLVGNHGGYLCDQTRSFSLGALPEHLTRAFEVARGILERVEEAARPGVPASRLYELAVRAAEESGFGDCFLGNEQKVSFVGHGIGLEVDELPFLARGFDASLEAGMVVAVEPKFIFPGEGVVGIEDTLRVTQTGVERLTLSPRALRVV